MVSQGNAYLLEVGSPDELSSSDPSEEKSGKSSQPLRLTVAGFLWQCCGSTDMCLHWREQYNLLESCTARQGRLKILNIPIMYLHASFLKVLIDVARLSWWTEAFVRFQSCLLCKRRAALFAPSIHAGRQCRKGSWGQSSQQVESSEKPPCCH